MEKIKNIMTKRPFTRVTYSGGMANSAFSDYNLQYTSVADDLQYTVVSQSEFMREFEPTGHKINSPFYYPNRIKYDEVKKRYLEERMIRCSFPFQNIIVIKHLCHLCGNDIQFELTSPKESAEQVNTFFEFQKGWLSKNMEITWYEAAKSAKITGDCAVAFYMREGRLYTKNLSFLKGDALYPHYDPVTGRLRLFARAYNTLNETGDTVERWCEVWDDVYMYRYRQGTSGILDNVKTAAREMLRLDGYRLVEKSPHNFSRVPIAYHRIDGGACWSKGQDSIDKYELAVSQLCQNNMAYAFPIMYLKGDDVRIEGDIYGSVKAITMGREDDAGFIGKPDASGPFELQLKILLNNIFTGTFTVLPPEMRSGDLPGVAVKLLYSPAVENAMADAKEYKPFIEQLMTLFREGYGIETSSLSRMMTLPIFGWIKPYVHQNDTELFANAAAGVQNGFLSAHSASEIATGTGYGKNYEWDRILKEQKEAQQADLLGEFKIKN